MGVCQSLCVVLLLLTCWNLHDLTQVLNLARGLLQVQRVHDLAEDVHQQSNVARDDHCSNNKQKKKRQEQNKQQR